MLDRETLVARNQRMTKAISRPALKHRRDRILTAISRIPIIPSQSESQRLLIIRPDHLGDVLLSTPAIQAIKRSHPDMIIHVLCGEWSADLLANYRDIDRILTLPFPGFRRGNDAATDPWRLAIQSARMLRKIGYSSAVIMRPDHWWGALLAYFRRNSSTDRLRQGQCRAVLDRILQIRIPPRCRTEYAAGGSLDR